MTIKFDKKNSTLQTQPLVFTDQPPANPSERIAYKRPYPEVRMSDVTYLIDKATGERIPVDVGIELRGAKQGMLVARVSWKEMTTMVVVPGTIVYLKNFTRANSQGAGIPETDITPGLMVFTRNDNDPNDAGKWRKLSDAPAGGGGDANMRYVRPVQADGLQETPLQGFPTIIGYDADDDVYEVTTASVQPPVFDANAAESGILTREGNTIGTMAAQGKVAVSEDGRAELTTRIAPVRFSKIDPEGVLEYVSIDNASEINAIDYATIAINSSDMSSLNKYGFLYAKPNEDGPLNKRRITTVITSGNALDVYPPHTAATIQILPGDNTRVCGIANGKMSQATIDEMKVDHASDTLSGMSWYNDDKARHEFVTEGNVTGVLPVMQNDKTTKNLSIGETAQTSSAKTNQIAIGEGAKALGSDEFVLGKSHNVIINGGDAGTNGTGALTIGGGTTANGLKPHLSLKRMQGTPNLDNTEAAYLYYGSDSKLHLASHSGAGDIQAEFVTDRITVATAEATSLKVTDLVDAGTVHSQDLLSVAIETDTLKVTGKITAEELDISGGIKLDDAIMDELTVRTVTASERITVNGVLVAQDLQVSGGVHLDDATMDELTVRNLNATDKVTTVNADVTGNLVAADIASQQITSVTLAVTDNVFAPTVNATAIEADTVVVGQQLTSDVIKCTLLEVDDINIERDLNVTTINCSGTANSQHVVTTRVDAQVVEVGDHLNSPKVTSPLIVGNSITSATISATGAITSGSMTTTNSTVTGTLGAAIANFSGAVNATGGVTANTLNVANATVTTALTSPKVTSPLIQGGNITCTTLTATGAIVADSITTTRPLTFSSLRVGNPSSSVIDPPNGILSEGFIVTQGGFIGVGFSLYPDPTLGGDPAVTISGDGEGNFQKLRTSGIGDIDGVGGYHAYSSTPTSAKNNINLTSNFISLVSSAKDNLAISGGVIGTADGQNSRNLDGVGNSALGAGVVNLSRGDRNTALSGAGLYASSAGPSGLGISCLAASDSTVLIEQGSDVRTCSVLSGSGITATSGSNINSFVASGSSFTRVNGNNNVAIGASNIDVVTGNNNVALANGNIGRSGSTALLTGNNNFAGGGGRVYANGSYNFVWGNGATIGATTSVASLPTGTGNFVLGSGGIIPVDTNSAIGNNCVVLGGGSISSSSSYNVAISSSSISGVALNSNISAQSSTLNARTRNSFVGGFGTISSGTGSGTTGIFNQQFCFGGNILSTASTNGVVASVGDVCFGGIIDYRTSTNGANSNNIAIGNGTMTLNSTTNGAVGNVIMGGATLKTNASYNFVGSNGKIFATAGVSGKADGNAALAGGSIGMANGGAEIGSVNVKNCFSVAADPTLGSITGSNNSSSASISNGLLSGSSLMGCTAIGATVAGGSNIYCTAISGGLISSSNNVNSVAMCGGVINTDGNNYMLRLGTSSSGRYATLAIHGQIVFDNNTGKLCTSRINSHDQTTTTPIDFGAPIRMAESTYPLSAGTGQALTATNSIAATGFNSRNFTNVGLFGDRSIVLTGGAQVASTSSMKIKDLEHELSDQQVETECTDLLRKIRVHKYRYKDKTKRRQEQAVYGVVAEQVREHWSDIVESMEDYSPGIMAPMEYVDGLLIDHNKQHAFKEHGKILIYQGGNRIFEYVVTSHKSLFVVNIEKNKKPCRARNQEDLQNGPVFVYGYLEDVPYVAKDNLYELNLGATKSLIREADLAKLEVESLKVEVSALRSELGDLKNKMREQEKILWAVVERINKGK